MIETCGVNNPEIDRKMLGSYKEILFFKNGKAVIRTIGCPRHQILLLKEEVDDLRNIMK